MESANRRSHEPESVKHVLAQLDGSVPGSALRVSADLSADGVVRLERLKHSPTAGWYVQKTFCIPRELLSALLPVLRKADCLMPKARRAEGDETVHKFPAK